MELKEQSDLIDLSLDTANGATSPILFYHKGYLSEEGTKARWFAAQVVEDNKLKIHRITDSKADSVTNAAKKFNFSNITTGLLKTGTMNYVNRMSTNRHCNVIMQTSPIREWVFYQVDWTNQTFKKSLSLDIEPDSSSTITYLTRHSNNLYLIVEDGSSDQHIYYIDLSTHPAHGAVASATDIISTVTPDVTAICAGETYFYVLEGGDLTVYFHGNFTTPFATYPGVTASTVAEIREIDDDDILVRISGSTLYRIESGVVTELSTALETDTEDFRILTRGDGVYVEAIDITRTVNTDDEHIDNWYILNEVEEINAKLDGTINEICNEVDISSEGVDVTDADLIATTIQGFLVNNYSISDAFLKQILVSYQVDMIESNGKLKFVARGKDSSQTIDTQRLGAAVVTSQIGNQFPERIARTYEASRLIPREIKIIYLEQQKDYDQTEQSIIRQDANNRDQVVLDMSAFAWTDSIARQIADKVIALYFSEKEQYVLFVSSYYYNVEPSDILTVNIDDEDVELRVTETLYTFPGILQIQAVFDNVDDYSSNVVGVEGDEPAQDFNVDKEFLPMILDTNLLFDQDYDDSIAGNYAVLLPIGESATDNINLLRSIQNIYTWSIVGSTEDVGIVGVCSTALPDGTKDIIDITSSVTVKIPITDTLVSITEEQLINNGNMCAIGTVQDQYEILNFQTVTDLGDGYWELSTFLRGKRGTDHLRSGHASGEDFIMLTDSVNVNDLNVDKIGVTYDYTGLENGSNLPENNDDIEITRSELVNRRGLPYSVCHDDATQDGSNNVIITWVRRTRTGGEWEDLVNAFESEPSESYEVDIMDGVDVKRTLTSSIATVTYSITDQTTDFGGAISTLTCEIYKMHDVFGRGYEKELVKTF